MPFDDESALTVSYDYETHSWPEEVTERLHQFRVTLEGRVWRKLWLAVFYEHDIWKNFAQIAGNTEGGNAVSVAAYWRF